MDPALAARIEASLRRSAGRANRGVYRPSLVAVVRVLVIVAIAGAAIAILHARARARAQFEQRRSALLDAARTHAAALTEEERTILVRAEASLRRLAGPYEGDFVASVPLGKEAFAAVLAAPAMYVRGNLADFESRPIDRASEESRKDALVACLYAPPAARDENTLVTNVRELRDASALDRRTPNVALLRDAEAGLPFLLPAWSVRVTSASTTKELARLEEAFAHAPIEEAKRAAHARYLVAVLDEGTGFVAFDGDFAHDVRVAIVDLRDASALLRVRRRVDPSWISVPRRAKYSVDVDGCALALDLRESLGKRE
jgi:hypothetical protein